MSSVAGGDLQHISTACEFVHLKPAPAGVCVIDEMVWIVGSEQPQAKLPVTWDHCDSIDGDRIIALHGELVRVGLLEAEI